MDSIFPFSHAGLTQNFILTSLDGLKLSRSQLVAGCTQRTCRHCGRWQARLDTGSRTLAPFVEPDIWTTMHYADGKLRLAFEAFGYT
jgi:hypothetical protein